MRLNDIMARQKKKIQLEQQITPIILDPEEYEEYPTNFPSLSSKFQRLYESDLMKFSSKTIQDYSATNIEVEKPSDTLQFLQRQKKLRELHEHYKEHGHCLYNRCYKQSMDHDKPRYLKQ